MWINYNQTYWGTYKRWKEEQENKELTFKEWVNTVKQLGMMHILYWRLKEFELYLEALNARRLHPFPAKTFYNGLKRERDLISALDRWEKEYHTEMKRLNKIKQHNNA